MEKSDISLRERWRSTSQVDVEAWGCLLGAVIWPQTFPVSPEASHPYTPLFLVLRVYALPLFHWVRQHLPAPVLRSGHTHRLLQAAGYTGRPHYFISYYLLGKPKSSKTKNITNGWPDHVRARYKYPSSLFSHCNRVDTMQSGCKLKLQILDKVQGLKSNFQTCCGEVTGIFSKKLLTNTQAGGKERQVCIKWGDWQGQGQHRYCKREWFEYQKIRRASLGKAAVTLAWFCRNGC